MKFPKNPILFALAICMCLIVSSCNEDVTVSLKTFSTYNVTNTSASVSGKVDIVGEDVVESGFLLTSNAVITPKYNNCIRYESTGTRSDVQVTFRGLSADSSYQYRLYAKTNDSIYYGTAYSFYPGSVDVTTVPVPAGIFNMGGTSEQAAFARADEFPVHQVTVSAFSMGATEVTNAQYLKFLRSRQVGRNGSGLSADGLSNRFISSKLRGLRYSTDSAAWIIDPGYENHPVVRVTWYGANEFCRWAGGRLPTEAEWEWAARGATSPSTLFSGGNLADSTAVAWYKFNTKTLPEGHKDTQPVGTKTKNLLNLYDMSGNAWEWVADWYNVYLSLPQTNPKGMDDADATESGLKNKVLRGGGWADPDVNALRVSCRKFNDPLTDSDSFGFRFVKD